METFREIEETEKTRNFLAKYYCKICDFHTSHKGSWNRHTLTAKHKKNEVQELQGNPLVKKTRKYICRFCEKNFKTKSGKWKHEQKCTKNTANYIIKKQLEEERAKNLKIVNEMKKMKLKLLAQENKSLLERVAILEKHKGGIQNIETQNNTTTNINIQLFLNENCSNAIPIMDFIGKLKFKLTDIDPERPKSTIESLTNIVVTELNQLDNSERPIHCADAKRLNFYVKDASDGWIKDKDNKKIDKAIGWANMRHQGAWHEYAKKKGLDSSKQKSVDYHKMNVAMGAWSDNPVKAKKQVKRAIAEATNLKNTKIINKI